MPVPPSIIVAPDHQVARDQVMDASRADTHGLFLKPDLRCIDADPSLGAVLGILAAWQRNENLLLLHSKLDSDTRAHVQAWAKETPAPALDEPYVLLPTSGSTGTPKVAVLSRSALVCAATSSATCLGWQLDDRWLLSLTPAHIGGLSIVLRCWLAQRPIVLPPPGPFHAQHWVTHMQACKVSLLSLVPTQLQRIVRCRLSPPASVRVVLVGGAHAPASLVESARALGWPVRRTYGSTESAGQLATERAAGNGMRPLDGAELRSDERGVLWVRSRQMFSGYLGSAPRTDGSWFETGDRGNLDSGVLHVVGRADAQIITGGQNVSPSRIEERLRALAGVVDACVVGLPDSDWGQVVAAALVTGPSFSTEGFEESQRDWAPSERVRVHACMDALPLLPNGKRDANRVLALLEVHKAKHATT